jgi:hypothetical protein
MTFPTYLELRKDTNFPAWVVRRPTSDGANDDRSYPIGRPILAASHTRSATSHKPGGK